MGITERHTHTNMYVHKIPPEEYYGSLPTKRMAAGAIFTNEQRDLLLVKTHYKEGWSIPGGTVDKDESPLAGCVREVREEIGLDLPPERFQLLCIDYTRQAGIKTESLQFVFSGGVLTQDEIARITLQASEIECYQFTAPEEALQITNAGVKGRLPACLTALKSGECVYRES